MTRRRVGADTGRAPPADGSQEVCSVQPIPPSRRRLLLAVPAALFAAWALLYTGSLLVAAQSETEVELGFNSDFRVAEHALALTEVFKGSPAEQAGLRPGDRIVAIDGRSLETDTVQPEEWLKHRAGDRVRLTVQRPGTGLPLVLTGTFRWRSPFGDAGYLVRRVQNSYPVPFVVVGLVVLFLRLDDRNAWLLALLFGSFATIPGFPGGFDGVAPPLRPILVAYRALWLSLLGALFYGFFAVFPARSPLDRRMPWLKWVGVGVGLSVGLPALGDGTLRLPPPIETVVGVGFSRGLSSYYELAGLTLGLASLAGSYLVARDAQSLRRIRVVFWGTIVGLTPGLTAYAAQLFAGVAAGPTLDPFINGALYLIPLSFAYAVARHRVLDVPVLLRRSARYLLVQRGFTFLLSLVSIGLTLAFAAWVVPGVQRHLPVTATSGIALGAMFGTALLWTGSQVHRRVSGRIDRAFFRAAYDAELILGDLVAQLRVVTSPSDLARLLTRHLAAALNPSFLVVYLPASNGRFDAVSGDAPPGLESLAPDLPAVTEVAASGRPIETVVQGALAAESPSGDRVAPVDAAADAECLVPIPAHDRALLGLILLGPRRSGEPYSGNDRRLLTGVAGQAGLALENIRLGDEVATRLDAERRALREMEIASDVQRKLLPGAPPVMRTLSCAAHCIQARAVGGDCYDYLELENGLVGLVLADVSGKGVHAALLGRICRHICAARPMPPLTTRPACCGRSIACCGRRPRRSTTPPCSSGSTTTTIGASGT